MTYHVVTRDGMDKVEAAWFAVDGFWLVFKKENGDPIRAYSAENTIKVFEA